jgi:hypothetical protein
MSNQHPRMARESKTLEAMISIYCRDLHGGKALPGSKAALCSECQELLHYARQRLDKCPFRENKTTCAKCPVHCYKPVMREKVRAVMRYAGPRMPRRHPILTLFHFMDGLRKEPVRPRRKADDA